MKPLAILSLFSLLFIHAGCSTSKYDKERLDVQRQEAHDMINKSKKIKIQKGLGDDKIILQDM